MTVEKALEKEIERAKRLIEEIRKIFPKLEKEYPTWAHVCDAKRFNSKLEEIIEIYQYQKYILF